MFTVEKIKMNKPQLKDNGASKMSYLRKMLDIPYDKFDGISVNQVETLCREADEEIAKLKSEIIRLADIIGGQDQHIANRILEAVKDE